VPVHPHFRDLAVLRLAEHRPPRIYPLPSSAAAIEAGNGAAFDPGECDAIFVNCGVTHPQTKWLERLGEGGRLLVPFTTAVNATIGQGVMMKIVRSNGKYAAELVSPVGIYSGGSLRDADLEPQLLKGLTTGRLLKVKSVRLDAHHAGETCVVHGRGVCLSLAEASWSVQETCKE